MDSSIPMELVLGTEPSRRIGSGCPALVIAELGQNHNGRRDVAEQLVDAAAWAGADGVKVVKRDLGCELTREGQKAGPRHRWRGRCRT